ncbi:Hypothetical protein CFV354_1561 [Campylobacter fetus subsp. venerealis NCTC 10354]|nr:Hypothetical protein CFV354_1561 [Campylobacter fetus subsp. venerealis NCTC 10354]
MGGGLKKTVELIKKRLPALSL